MLVGTLASLIGFVWVSFWAAPLFAIVFVYASRTLAALLEDPGAPNRVGRIALTAVGLAVTGSLILLTIGAVALIVGILLNGPMVG